MTTPSSSPTGRRSTWLRKLLWIFGGLIVLLVAAYFVVTSSAFVKGVILPRAGKAFGGEVTVADAAISPLSSVDLHQLTIKTTGTEPLLQVDEVRLRYSLSAILGGTLQADEITIVSPVVQIIYNADGSCNLDPLLTNGTKQGVQPAPGNTPSKPPQIDLKNFTVTNATFRLIRNFKDGSREVSELTGVNTTLDQLKNGQPGKLTTTASFKMTRPTNDVIEAKSTGDIEFVLGADLMPQSLKANIEEEIVRAEGSLSGLAGVRTVFASDIAPGEIKEVSQRVLRGDQLLGEVKVSGPFDLSKKEGHLKIEIASIDRQVLNLIGAPLGLDFGATTLNYTTEVTLTQGGAAIAASTRFSATKFNVTQKGQSTPPVDLQLAYDVTVNPAAQTATVQTFTLDGTQDQKPLLHGSLQKPMTIAWGANAAAPEDSDFELAVTDFDFAAWKPFLGDAVSAGQLSLKFDLHSGQGGKQIKFGVTSQIAGLAAKIGATPLADAALALKLDGQVNDFKKFTLDDYSLDLTQQAQPALTVSGSAGYDGAAFNLQSQVEVVMARLMGSGPAAPLSAGVKLDGSFANQALDLRQLQLTFAPTQRAASNELTLAGHLDLGTPGVIKGSLTVKGDTLDLTQLYDTFTGGKNSATTPAATTSPSPASGNNEEPDPVQLPVQLGLEANLGQVYLREMAVSNFQATVKVDGGKIKLDPCQLTLNGAPVNASVDLDLGVKGYTYVLSMQMDHVPMEPIANSFSPNTRGQYQGMILANAKINGAGITGTSLQKNLGGQTSFTLTNANIQLMGPKIKKMVDPIATLLRLGAITQSPLNWVDAQIDMGGGNIKLTRFTVESPAFEAGVQGVIPIDKVLTNSPLDLPVQFSLQRSLAEKASLLPANTPDNATYAALPDFITVKGTVGAPKSDLNQMALAQLLLQSGAGITKQLGNLGGKVGNPIQGIGGLLGGPKPAGTNQPGANAAPKSNPLNLFK